MSLSTIQQILLRVEVATEKSPIAIFRTPAALTERLDSMFADTIYSKRYIKSNQEDLIGIFDKSTNADILREKLIRELRVPANLLRHYRELSV